MIFDDIGTCPATKSLHQLPPIECTFPPFLFLYHHPFLCLPNWLGGSVVERRSLIGELSLVCTGPAADG